MKKLILLASIALMTTGCSTIEKMAGKVPATATCPEIGFLLGGDHSAFTDNGIEYSTAMTNLGGSCSYDDSAIDVESRFYIILKAKDITAPIEPQGFSVPFVAAVLGADEQILSRRSLNANVEVDENGTGFSLQELTQTIPVSTPKQGGTYKVIYTFPEE